VDSAAVAAARALLAMIAVVAVAVVVVAVVSCLLTIEPESPEEYVTSIGPLEPVIVTSTVRSGTKLGPESRFLRPPHNPRIIAPTFSHQKGWPLTMAPS
jgi:hypothetical protein